MFLELVYVWEAFHLLFLVFRHFMHYLVIFTTCRVLCQCMLIFMHLKLTCNRFVSWCVSWGQKGNTSMWKH